MGGRRGPWQAPATPSWPQPPSPLAAGTAETSGQPEAQIVQGWGKAGGEHGCLMVVTPVTCSLQGKYLPVTVI